MIFAIGCFFSELEMGGILKNFTMSNEKTLKIAFFEKFNYYGKATYDPKPQENGNLSKLWFYAGCFASWGRYNYSFYPGLYWENWDIWDIVKN